MNSLLEYTEKKETTQMSVLELLKQGPTLCDARNPERWAQVAELIWQHETENSGSVFSQNEEDMENPRGRFQQITAWAESCDDRRKASHILDKLELNAIKHRELEHDDTDSARQYRAKVLTAQIENDEPNYPDVAALLPLEQILLGVWF